ncbi:Hypothetical predicted protein [Podarcis lilfordi]|uniref:Uncharacterized protein n=1 Tax=Podarcis lilfordi TaxID=74358 RepID=A0AA35PCR1_9SAUR|nr:Hypothetical predicted protein [Podarcis lilfordi]
MSDAPLPALSGAFGQLEPAPQTSLLQSAPPVAARTPGDWPSENRQWAACCPTAIITIITIATIINSIIVIFLN